MIVAPGHRKVDTYVVQLLLLHPNYAISEVLKFKFQLGDIARFVHCMHICSACMR